MQKLKGALWDTFERGEITGIIEHIGNIAIVVEIMTGSKKKSRYRKKRRGKGFGGSRRKEKSRDEASVETREPVIDQPSPGTSLERSGLSDALADESGEDSDRPISSSRKKMKLEISSDESSSSSAEETEAVVDTSGYRLVDLKSLSSVLSFAHKCEKGESIK